MLLLEYQLSNRLISNINKRCIKGTTIKTTQVNSIIRKLYVESEGTVIEVKQIDNPEDYPKSVTIYSKEAVKGTAKGSTIYAVPVADFVPKKRVSTKESVANMVASGMSAEEILAKLQGL